jgi:hypothetical protein
MLNWSASHEEKSICSRNKCRRVYRGAKGEANWTGTDPEVDVLALWSHFDTLLMGRKTLLGSYPETGREDVCRSYQHRVLAHDEGTGHPGVTIISTQPVTAR